MQRSAWRQRTLGWFAASTFCLGGLLGWAVLEGQSEEKARAPHTEPSWELADCATCHADAVESVTRTGHVALDRDGLAAVLGAARSCGGCHGDPSAHLDNLGGTDLFGFDEAPAENSRRCLSCHADEHPRYDRSEHGRSGLDCSACHASHPPAEAPPPPAIASMDPAGRPSESCAGCHEASFAQFSFTTHHRLEEGDLECTSCHDPHAPSARTMLAGFKQESCVSCHADKGGPFVFEHGAQRVEGCTSCHEAHGSPNRHMLRFQRVAEQCYSCHAFVPGFHSRFTAETQCTSCHVTIHGSNLDPGFLR